MLYVCVYNIYIYKRKKILNRENYTINFRINLQGEKERRKGCLLLKYSKNLNLVYIRWNEENNTRIPNKL